MISPAEQWRSRHRRYNLPFYTDGTGRVHKLDGSTSPWLERVNRDRQEAESAPELPGVYVIPCTPQKTVFLFPSNGENAGKEESASTFPLLPVSPNALDIVMGLQHPGEQPRDAVRRELQEEIKQEFGITLSGAGLTNSLGPTTTLQRRGEGVQERGMVKINGSGFIIQLTTAQAEQLRQDPRTLEVPVGRLTLALLNSELNLRAPARQALLTFLADHEAVGAASEGAGVSEAGQSTEAP